MRWPAPTGRTAAGLIGSALRLLPFAAVLACIVLVWSQIGGFGASLVKNRAWVRSAEVPSLSQLNEAVFERLVANRLIWAEREPGQVLLRHSPCTNVTRSAPDKVAERGSAPEERLQQMFDLLCLSPQGSFIQDEIEAWNLSYQLLAIRDNRNMVRPEVTLPASGKRAASKGATSKGARKPPPPPRLERKVKACDKDEKDKTVTVRFVVPHHCYENRWAATYLTEGTAGVPAQVNPNAEPPGRDYAFLALDNIAYPGDWRVVAPFLGDRERAAARPSGRYELSSDIEIGSEPITVEVVGAVREVRVALGSAIGAWEIAPGGTARALDPAPRLAVTVRAEIVCDASEDVQVRDPCETDPAKREPFAHRITLSARQAATVKVVLRVDPARVRATEFDEADEGEAAKPAVDVRAQRGCAGRIGLARATNIRACCAPPHPTDAQAGASGTCDLWWAESRSAERRGKAEARVFVAGGTDSLVTPAGLLEDVAFKRDLAQIVGFGPSTYGSLARSLVRADDQTVRLTIDPAYQDLAIGSLQGGIKCRRGQKDPCEDASRGTLVVMDAESGPSGGQILAMASWPPMQPGMGAWDLAALDAGQPSESPIAGNAWRAHDVSAMAGSTFKVVTALAAMQHVLATRDETLRAILLGTSPLETIDRALRIGQVPYDKIDDSSCNPSKPVPPGAGNVLAPKNDDGFYSKCLSNSHNEALTASPNASDKLTRIGQFCMRDRPNRFGLCEAMAKSSNLYFGGMALYLDAPSFEVLKPRGALPQLALARMTRRLFPDGLGEPATPEGARGEPGRQDARAPRNLPLVDLGRNTPLRLGASPFRLPAEAARNERNGVTRQLELAQNGFGQAVTATPVAIATVYASVGAQTLLRPTLVPLPAGKPRRDADAAAGQSLLAVPPDRRDDYERMMAELKRGLKGVVQAGTAADPRDFPRGNLPKALVDSLYLKTGTAVLPIKGRNRRTLYSSSLAGWIDPPPGITSGITRRIAVACQISRTIDFGAGACGKIVAAFIDGLHGKVGARAPGR
ncbi:hypothetical protein [Methylobacterium aquaticum]|uniref:Beta-lactamase n=1 Tax=Methylobacterium aquaticum TaxID=270351 RepID=A0A0J6T5J0_9HYPH|nr:hypothetical protein [Methylobacterium aquaticum]KMO41067.1 hypothetical protein VP06_01405 [Methylobacterium aquaticum]